MRRKPIIALIYDFDGTLSPGNMQEFGFIQAIGQTPEEFWSKSDGIAKGQDASNILAYMKLMFDEAHANGVQGSNTYRCPFNWLFINLFGYPFRAFRVFGAAKIYKKTIE